LAVAATAAVAAAKAATTAAAKAAATATAAAAAAIFARFGFVDVQSTTINFFSIELSNGGCAFFLGGHFDEAKAP
jgi:hypothetical protein